MEKRLDNIHSKAILLLCLTLMFPALEELRANDWPFNDFDYVIGYTFDSMQEKTPSIIVGNRLHKGVFLKSEKLDQEKIRILFEYIFKNKEKGEEVDLDCNFMPHHAFVFYNNKDQTVGYINICFLCNEYRLWPEDHLSHQINWTKIETLIKKLNFPVYDSPYKYKNRYLEEKDKVKKQ